MGGMTGHGLPKTFYDGTAVVARRQTELPRPGFIPAVDLAAEIYMALVPAEN